MPAQALSMTTSTPRLPYSLPSERPADGSLRSDFSPISISGRGLHRGRGAIPREPLSGRHSQTILGPAGVIQDMCLDDTDKGREAFSKIKALLRKAQARTREGLIEAMGTAISAVTTRDARGFLEHCGYRRAGQLL